jgi:hypothetical protein
MKHGWFMDQRNQNLAHGGNSDSRTSNVALVIKHLDPPRG